MKKALHLKANKDTTITLKKNALKIQACTKPIQWVPLAQVESIFLHGPVQLPVNLFYYCLEQKIPVTVLSYKNNEKGFFIPSKRDQSPYTLEPLLEAVFDSCELEEQFKDWINIKASQYYQKNLKKVLSSRKNWNRKLAKNFIDYLIEKKKNSFNAQKK